MEERITIKNSEGQEISGILHIPNVENPPAIIIAHGYGGYAFSERFESIASELCKAGYAVLRFVFRCYDPVTGDKDTEEFKDLTISGEASDLKAVVDFMYQKGYKKIGLTSESLGGVIIILLNDPRIKAIAPWSANIHVRDVFEGLYGKEMLKELEEKGYSTYISHTTGEKSVVGRNFWEEVKKIGDIPENKIKEIKCPILIIQGDKDEYFNVKIAEDLYNLANEPKKLVIVEGANHTFTNSEHQKQLVNSILDWFNKYLK